MAQLFEQAFRIAGERLACGHFHDTRGLEGETLHGALWRAGLPKTMTI